MIEAEPIRDLEARRAYNLAAGATVAESARRFEKAVKKAKSSRDGALRLVDVMKANSSTMKKFVAVFATGKGRSKYQLFGAAGMSDYTIHKNKKRRHKYWSRHQKDLRTGDPTRAGYLSWFILWNLPSFSESVADFRRRLVEYNKKGTFPLRIKWNCKDCKTKKKLSGGKRRSRRPPSCSDVVATCSKSTSRGCPKKCKANDRFYDLPRKYSPKQCRAHRGKMGFTMRASCAPYAERRKGTSSPQRRRRRKDRAPPQYLKGLSAKDRKAYKREILKDRAAYRAGNRIIRTRPKMKSYNNQKSPHVRRAKRMYNVSSVGATPEYASKTGCTVEGLEKILKKGRGAYGSSGSRANQTPESWAVARLGSATTGGPSARIDRHILEEHCRPKSRPRRLLEQRFPKKKRCRFPQEVR